MDGSENETKERKKEWTDGRNNKKIKEGRKDICIDRRKKRNKKERKLGIMKGKSKCKKYVRIGRKRKMDKGTIEG